MPGRSTWRSTAPIRLMRSSISSRAAAVRSFEKRSWRSRLGWRALIGAEETVDWTVEWHRRLAGGESPAALCREQLDAFWRRAADAAV